jgi:hypothetical protein
MKNKSRKDLLETLADLEHRQWSHWTRYFLDNLTDENITRWRRQILTSYHDLSEAEKDSDRTWATHVLFVFDEWERENE